MQTKLTDTKLIVSAMKRLQKLQLSQAFDPIDETSRPTDAQQTVLNDIETIQFRYVIAGNQSGKSALAAREVAWIVTDTHPFWKRPDRWGDEPLLILIAGQDRKQMEIELWSKKIKPFLEMAEWKEVRVGGVLNFVEHRRFAHKIVFLSHNDASDKNRQHMQGYVAHYVWLDEMPRNLKILEELQRRVDARRGYVIVTFTPKIRNEEIRRVVDSAVEPIAKKYRLSKLDNPLYADRLDEEVTKLAGYSDAYRQTILYGDWYSGDNAVYQFDYAHSVVEEVPNYTPAWRHVVSVDPALKSKFGFTVWAEDPGEGIWYLIRDEYITNILNPDDLVKKVQEMTAGLNIVKRISDPHESWFIGQAAKYRLIYVSPYDKSNRKGILIKQLQTCLALGKIKIASWCRTFIDEIGSCQWAEGSDRMINSSSYHTLDASQYFCDLIPPYDETQRALPWYVELRQQNEERKQRKAAEAVAQSTGAGARVRRSIRAWAESKHKRGTWS